jgi:hypothetical protein
VSGVLLILLGAWGGLAPFVGPYFHFAYTPDKTWAYTSGRLYLSIVPGAAALIGGLLVTGTANRAIGIFGSLLAAVGGAWFIVGGSITVLVVKNGSIGPGFPVAGSLGSLSSASRQFLETMGFFTGVGMLILFLAALALGRFSVVAVNHDGPVPFGGPVPARRADGDGDAGAAHRHPGAAHRHPGAVPDHNEPVRRVQDGTAVGPELAAGGGVPRANANARSRSRAACR